MVGIFTGHKDGRPPKLTAEVLDMAADIARSEPLTLAKIAIRVLDQYPDTPSVSLDRLLVGLNARKLSFKRTRLSIEKRDEAAFQEAQGRLARRQGRAKADK